MKQQRWYKIDGDAVHIYDHPVPRLARSESIVTKSDLPYFRNHFRLERCWNLTEEGYVL